MHGKFESRHALVGLSDELIRLNGRMKALFANARRPEGLGDSEMAVLNAVVEADSPPASLPSKAANASSKSPVDIPFR